MNGKSLIVVKVMLLWMNTYMDGEYIFLFLPRLMRGDSPFSHVSFIMDIVECVHILIFK